MSMRVVYLQDHDDGHKKGKDYFVEVTLGRRLCDNGVTIPYVTHLKNLEAEKEAEAKAKAKAKTEKVKKLLEKKAVEKADSKLAKTRSKTITYK